MIYVWLALTVVQACAGFGYLAWLVWRDQVRTHENEAGRLQKGYTYQDRERGKVYWYLRSKHKLSRQMAGLQEQMELARRERDQLETLFKQQRARLKELSSLSSQGPTVR